MGIKVTKPGNLVWLTLKFFSSALNLSVTDIALKIEEIRFL
jgi:hypothetical protein